MSDAQDRGWGPPCPAARIVPIDVGGRRFQVHQRVAPIFRAFLTELVTRGYRIDQGTLDDWSYNCRKIAGSTTWSNHAWGLAIDINSLRNPMRAPLTTDMPAWVRDPADLMARYGLRWGGSYRTTPDPMHFEFMLRPEDADRIAAQLHPQQEDDLYDADAEARLFRRLEEAERRIARYVDHGNPEQSGSDDHHERIRADIAALRAQLLAAVQALHTEALAAIRAVAPELTDAQLEVLSARLAARLGRLTGTVELHPDAAVA